MRKWSSNPEIDRSLSKENIPASHLTEWPLSEHVLNMLKLEVNTLVYSTNIESEAYLQVKCQQRVRTKCEQLC